MLEFYYKTTFAAMYCNFNLVNRHIYKSARHEQTLTVVILNYETGKPAYPSFSTDESYTLTLDWGNWILSASNCYGFLRGFESFAQLFETLLDPPYYKLNYLPLAIADAPELNVFHWHLTDEESFPLQLKNIPLITQYGAYAAEEVYSRADIVEIVKYARMRGIRVIPEVDSPAVSHLIMLILP